MTEFNEQQVEAALHKLKASWGWLVAIGIISIIGGLLCFANPFAATMTVDYLAGFMFILVGVTQIIQAFSVRGWGGFLWTLGVGVLAVLVGAVLVGQPIMGATYLTIMVAGLLVFMGVAKFAFSFSMRPEPGWLWVMLSGIISIILAILIFTNFPWSAVTVLGLFLGVELTFNGVMLLMTGLALRNS